MQSVDGYLVERLILTDFHLSGTKGGSRPKAVRREKQKRVELPLLKAANKVIG